MKRIILLTLISLSFSFAGNLPADKARGIFVAVAVGPRIPFSDFAKSTNIGYGFNLELAYTDNEYLPVFLFGKVGFEQFSASQDFYQTSDYSHLSHQFLPFQFGVRYYLPPILENIIIIIPSIEFGTNFLIYQNLHQFKINSGRANFLEDGSKFGFAAGVGVSMFLIEALVSYNYFKSTQYFVLDLKVRLPLFVSL
jgi:opacity protein-like surface antigen